MKACVVGAGLERYATAFGVAGRLQTSTTVTPRPTPPSEEQTCRS